MICPKCHGSGEIKHDWLPNETCHNCGGSGYVNMTNEEWLRSATTEQLADVLLEHFEWGLSINAEYCFTEKYVEQNREHILEWLKQPHTKGVTDETKMATAY